jgi:diguanylate cyclase (GGDEF)-like protein
MSRASTLLLALLILNILLGVLCLVVARGERKSAALRLWGWGMLLYSAGLLVTIATAWPFDLRKVLGNAMIAYAPILTVEGALAYTTFRLDRRWTMLAFVATVIPIVINHTAGHYNVLIDILAPGPIANILFMLAAIVLVRRPPPDARFAARFVAGIFTYNVIVWSLRMYLVWASIGATNDRDRADLTIALFGIAQMVAAVASTLGLFWIEVRNMEAELRRQANTDPLTTLPNRRATVQRFNDELARAARNGRAFALVLFDVDHFKRVNDTYGHHVGDAALRYVADALRTAQRNVDLTGRIGGEEFVVLLGEQDAGGAGTAANRLREHVGAGIVRHDGTELSVTLSGGVAVYPDDGTSWDELFLAADRRLYDAKTGGRNRIAIATPRASL